MNRMLWFILAGGGGFLIDAGATHVLITAAGIRPFVARVPAIMAAMALTWFVNRRRTFGPSRHSLAEEGFRYWAVGITSAVLNYALYSSLIAVMPMLQPMA